MNDGIWEKALPGACARGVRRGRRSLLPAALSAVLWVVAMLAAPLTLADRGDQGTQKGTAVESAAAIEPAAPDAHATGGSTAPGNRLSEATRLHLPRPSIMALIGFGLLGVGAVLRRRERNGVHAPSGSGEPSADSSAVAVQYDKVSQTSAGRTVAQTGGAEITGIESGSA